MPARAVTKRTKVGGVLMLVGLLAIAAGFSVSTAAASGESTTVELTSPLSGTSHTFTWTYTFHRNGGHDLSNVAIKFCSPQLLAHVASASPNGEIFLSGDVPGGHAGFGPGIKFPVTAVTGTLTVVFDQAYAGGGSAVVESHSGDGQEPDLQTVGSGPAACDPPVTTTRPLVTTTVPEVTTTIPGVTTTVPGVTTTLPEVTTIPVVTTTVPVGGATVPVITTTVPPGAPGSVATEVLGKRYVDPEAALASTGSDTFGPLVAAGAIVMVLGLALVAGDRVSGADQ